MAAALTDPTPIRYFYLTVHPDETKFSLKLPGALDLSDGVQRYVAFLKLSMSQRIINAPSAATGQYTMEFWDVDNPGNDFSIGGGEVVPFTGGIYHNRPSIVAGLNQLFFDVPLAAVVETPTTLYPLKGRADGSVNESFRDVLAIAEEDTETTNGIILTLGPGVLMRASPALAKLLGITPTDAAFLIGSGSVVEREALESERKITLRQSLWRDIDLFPSQFHLLCTQLLTGAPIYSSRPGGMSPILGIINAPSSPGDFTTGSLLNAEPERPIWLPNSSHALVSEIHVNRVEANDTSGETLFLRQGFGHLLIAISTIKP